MITPFNHVRVVRGGDLAAQIGAGYLDQGVGQVTSGDLELGGRWMLMDISPVS